MKNLYLAMYKVKDNPKATRLDKVIAWVTRSNYSHVEFCFNVNPHGFSHCFSISPREDKVRFLEIKLVDTSWDVYKLDIDIPTESFHQLCLEVNPYRYDWLGAITSPLYKIQHFIKIRLEVRTRYFCSELGSHLLKDVGVPLLYPSSYYTPSKLLKELITLGVAHKVDLYQI